LNCVRRQESERQGIFRFQGSAPAREPPALVIAVPPRTLASLRKAIHADVKARDSSFVYKGSPGDEQAEGA